MSEDIADPEVQELIRAGRRAVLELDSLFEANPVDREDRGCWCPDAFLETGLNVNYCPRHGSQPDPELD